MRRYNIMTLNLLNKMIHNEPVKFSNNPSWDGAQILPLLHT